MGISLGSNADFTVLDASEDEEIPLGEVLALDGQLASRKRPAGEYARARNARAGRYRPAVVEDDEVVMQDSIAPILSAEESQTQPASSQRNQEGNGGVQDNHPRQIQRRNPPKTMDAATRDKLKEEITNKLLAVAVPPTITLGDLMFISPQLRSQVRSVANSYEPASAVSSGVPVMPTTSVHLTQARELPKISSSARANNVNTLIPDTRRSVRVAQERSENVTREYARGLLKTKVYIHGHELQATIDWGSSVNLIPLKTAQMLGLEIRKDPRLYMVPVDGRTRPFYGVAEFLPISIGDITTHSYCMIAKDVTVEILLGRI